MKCNPKAVKEFDYSSLSPEFFKLPKPAQRALVNNGIYTPKGLSRKTLDEVRAFHGLGSSSVPVLEKILKSQGLSFKSK